MQLYLMPLLFIGRVVGLSALLFWASLTFAGGPFLGSLKLEAVGAYAISFSVLLVDAVLIYPRLRSPVRKLPIVPYGYSGKMVVEKPRGKTPLKWATQNPDADIFNSRGPLGDSVLYPVSPAALKDVFATNSYDFVKPIGLRNYLSQFIGWGLITIEGAQHKEQRRAIHPSFNIKNIRALYATMWAKAGSLVARLEQEMNDVGQIDVGRWASKFAFDIIGRGALSRDFNAIEMKEYHPVAESFSKCVEPERWMLHYLMSTLALPVSVVKLFHPRGRAFIEKEAGSIRQAAEELLDQAKETPPREGDILKSIIEDASLSRAEIVDNMLTFIGAGHETSASSIIWACHLLSLAPNQGYQDKLRDEVRRAFPTRDDGLSDWAAPSSALQSLIETLPWLNGCCEEVLRLYPTVPATMRETVRQTTMAGTVIPKGMLVVVMPWVINRNPKYWGRDADEFRPERWIDKTPDGGLRANKNGGAPSNFCEATFLHGPRACVGRDFARSELKCALAAIFGRFRVERLDGDDGQKIKVSGQVTIKPKGGLFVRLTPVPGW